MNEPSATSGGAAPAPKKRAAATLGTARKAKSAARPPKKRAKAAPEPAAEIVDSDDEPGVDEDPARMFAILREGILALSHAKMWGEACREWELETIEDAPEGTCLCSKTPITKRCHIYNSRTGTRTVVGSSCIKRFDASARELKRDCTSAFASLRRVAADPWGARASAALVELARRRDALKSEVADIVLDIGRKRPTERQLVLLARANVDILNAFFHAPSCACAPPQQTLPMLLRINSTTGSLFYGCRTFGTAQACRLTRPDPLQRVRGVDVATRVKRSYVEATAPPEDDD